MATTELTAGTTTADNEAANDAPRFGLIPVDRVRIGPNNPRGEVNEESDEFVALQASIEECGVLTPISVKPPTADGWYDLVAGERRQRAARAAGLTQIPAVFTRVDLDDPEADAKTFAQAVAENAAREDMNIVAEARSCYRLAELGWSVERIARHTGYTERLVRARLPIMSLPAVIHPRLADGTIPRSTVPVLAELSTVHPELPAVFIARLLDGKRVAHDPEGAMSWDRAHRDPVGVLAAEYSGPGTALPEGIHPSTGCRPGMLPLSAGALEDVEVIAKESKRDPSEYILYLRGAPTEQALALSATYPAGPARAHLILGTDVYHQIIEDELRAKATPIREQRAKEAAPTVDIGDADAQEARRLHRAKELENRAAARRHNEELGAAVWAHLLNVRVTDEVLHALVVAQPMAELGRLGEAGARYCGWITHTTTPTGRTKDIYPTMNECLRKATEFLAAGDDLSSRAGRLLALLAMARYARADAVPMSKRSRYSLRLPYTGSPWEQDPRDLIDDVCADLLPAHLTAAARKARKADRIAAEKRREARARLATHEGNYDGLDADGLKQVLADSRTLYESWNPEGKKIRKAVAKARAALRKAAKAAEQTPTPA